MHAYKILTYDSCNDSHGTKYWRTVFQRVTALKESWFQVLYTSYKKLSTGDWSTNVGYCATFYPMRVLVTYLFTNGIETQLYTLALRRQPGSAPHLLPVAAGKLPTSLSAPLHTDCG
jgi:hypothetical protein